MKYYFDNDKSYLDINFYEKLDNGLIFLPSEWDDYHFKTSFKVLLINESLEDSPIELGIVKIGINPKYSLEIDNDLVGYYTYDHIMNFLNNSSKNFLTSFPKEFFIIGDVNYYKNLNSYVKEKDREKIYLATNDIIFNKNIFNSIKNLPVVTKSFFRDKSFSSIKQLRRVINGGKEFQPFHFILRYKNKINNEKFDINIKNDLESILPSNSFALIGENGIGKTSILKDFCLTAFKIGKYVNSAFLSGYNVKLIDKHEDDFINEVTNLIFINYSMFDVFNKNYSNIFQNENKYKFVGGRSDNKLNEIISPNRFSSSLEIDIEWICYDTDSRNLLYDVLKNFDWNDSLHRIVSQIERVSYTSDEEGDRSKLQKQLQNISSGQKIILSIIINLIKYSNENSVILIDEPELYLHPPFVLSLIMSINDIASRRNAICIMATHSAVVLQELPKKNVFVIKRNGKKKILRHPKIETFATDTQTINDEIFGLDIRSTGYYKILKTLYEKKPNKIKELIKKGELGEDAIIYLSSF